MIVDPYKMFFSFFFFWTSRAIFSISIFKRMPVKFIICMNYLLQKEIRRFRVSKPQSQSWVRIADLE